MLSYRWSTAADFERILDTANRIFSLRVNEDGTECYDHAYFSVLQPKLYRNAEIMPPHLLALAGDRLVGLAALRVYPVLMGGQQVLVGGVGTVGVLHEYRSQGIMRELMARLNAEMAARGVTLGELGGKRTRYAHFGYFTGGYGLEFNFERGDCLPFSADGYTVEELSGDAGAEDVRLFLSLYERTSVHAARTEADFVAALRSAKRRPYRIRHAGRTVGYLSADPGLDAIREVEVEDPATLPNVLHAFFNEVGKPSLLVYGIAPADTEKTGILAPLATSVKLAGRERYRIFDYRTLMEAGLRARAEWGQLLPGTVSFAIEQYGTVTATVGETVEVTRTETVSGTVLSGEEATRLLLGMPSPCGFSGKNLPPLAFAWFPLPLHTSPCDRV